MNKKQLSILLALATIATNNKDGFTVNAATLQPVTTGYAVAVAATQNSFGLEGLANVVKYVDEHPEINAFGGWYNSENKWKLSNEKYWLAMAAATNSLMLSDMDAEHAACMLFAEVCDWAELEKNVDLTAAEEENLKGVLSELTDSEAWEVFKMLHVFWNYKKDQGDMIQWAMDVTWWPAWLPEELKGTDEDIEEES